MKWDLLAQWLTGCSSSMKVRLWKAARQKRYSRAPRKIGPNYSSRKSFRIRIKKSRRRRLFLILMFLCIKPARPLSIYPDRIMSTWKSSKLYVFLKWLQYLYADLIRINNGIHFHVDFVFRIRLLNDYS